LIERAQSVVFYFEDHKESGELGRLALRGANADDAFDPSGIAIDETVVRPL
jgi:hypothetical protein